VWQNPDAGKPYGIEVIPTQIFYDAEGKELFRHVGFFAKEDILAKWKELGIELGKKP
jgi:thioredoxin 1